MSIRFKRPIVIIFTIVLLFGMSFGFTSCAENADATVVPEETLPSYDEMHKLTEDYVIAYSNFMLNSTATDVSIYTSEGTTPAGNICSATFIESNDSKYINLVLEVDRQDSFDCDEYYRIDASHIFIARSSIAPDNSIIGIFKYIIIDDVLYRIDEQNQTVTPVDRQDSLDLYLSFEEIITLYSGK
ncbi:MAG: hypothetical protein MJ172_05495 [Clostridia bacterium]|nr:hypothetical protein [Clostridia bacterium]